jgi:hypothetical protein
LTNDASAGEPRPGPTTVLRIARHHVMIETPVRRTEAEKIPAAVSLHSPALWKGSG